MRLKLMWLIRYLIGKTRIRLGFCPLCNSDAPELYTCPCCNFYSSASGDPFPPTLATKSDWWKTYKAVIDCQLKLGLALIDSKNKRKGGE